MDVEDAGGTSWLGQDLTDDQLGAAPVLGSVDDLVIEGLTDAEADAFLAACGAEAVDEPS